MNPNTSLEVIRQAIRYDGPLSDRDRLDMIAEDFTALDEWLSNGGSPPAAWNHSTDARNV